MTDAEVSPSPKLSAVSLMAFLDDGTCHQVALTKDQRIELARFARVLCGGGSLPLIKTALPIATSVKDFEEELKP